jgi:hypothetical protein
MRPPSPAQARGLPTLLFEVKPPGDTESKDPFSLSRRNMRFRQAQRRRGAALGATPPPLAVASLPAVALAKVGCHHIRPQNRRAVKLSVRFCSFYFAAVPFWCHRPPLFVAWRLRTSFRPCMFRT